jgi:hypothetical protein
MIISHDDVGNIIDVKFIHEIRMNNELIQCQKGSDDAHKLTSIPQKSNRPPTSLINNFPEVFIS